MRDQISFSELSGDSNPLHVDPNEARRLLFGQVVVHGVHGVLWALENSLQHLKQWEILTLDAEFLSPLFLNMNVDLIADDLMGDVKKIRLVCNGETVTKIKFSVSDGPKLFKNWKVNTEFPTQDCRLLTNDDFDNAEGNLSLNLPSEAYRKLFPNLSQNTIDLPTAVLLSATRLVGMECPGRNSVFNRLKLNFGSTETKDQNNFHYVLTKRYTSMPLMKIKVSGPKFEGEITASERPMPVRQSTFFDIKKNHQGSQFVGKTALIIGGGRGLGEVTAKLFAANGGAVILTYASGKDNVEAVVNEINEQGGKAEYYQLNLLDDDLDFALDKFENLTHCFNYASPRIMAEKSNSFNKGLFGIYSQFYVEGLDKIVQSFLKKRKDELIVFYPSTAFIDFPQKGFSEYAAAKAAGEVLGKTLSKVHKNVKFHFSRLPPLRTDQTTALVPVKSEEPAEILAVEFQKL